jgi:hypothetical protein
MMRGCDAVSCPEIFDFIPYLFHLASDLMSKNKRSLVQTVPFQDITSADPAGFDLHQQFSSLYLRDGKIFNTNVGIAVIYCCTHEVCHFLASRYYE